MGIKVLDCTLRDGAYVLNSNFGEERISGIISALESVGVDIIECGWLRDVEKKYGSVLYNQPGDLVYGNKNLALMFDYGRYDINKLEAKCDNNVDIIRVAFYKDDLYKIQNVVEIIKNKGYKVFLQASNTIAYTEKEIENLCSIANSFEVDSVYIVDSYGSMFPQDLDRIISMYKEFVSPKIEIGLHSHNNIQLSFGLALRFIESLPDRNIILDSSLCGMGRGAGNTQTELLLEYLVRKCIKEYNTKEIWNCIKKYIEPLYENYFWGYKPQNGYKGLNGLHPTLGDEKIFSK